MSTGFNSQQPEIERERGRGNGSFSGVEVLKPKGFKDPPDGGNVKFPAARNKKK
ncbi:MAG: hypothetical protein WC831_04860 [Parcubacteria group bacterium]